MRYTHTWWMTEHLCECLPYCDDIIMMSSFTVSTNCPILMIANGMVSYQPQGIPPMIGATASYTCNTAYPLSGNDIRTCQEIGNGTWTGSDPSCNREYITIHHAVKARLSRCECLKTFHRQQNRVSLYQEYNFLHMVDLVTVWSASAWVLIQCHDISLLIPFVGGVASSSDVATMAIVIAVAFLLISYY